MKFALHYDDVYKSGVLVNLTRKSTFSKMMLLPLIWFLATITGLT